MMEHLKIGWCFAERPHSTRASGITLATMAPPGVAARAQATGPASTTSSRETLGLARHYYIRCSRMQTGFQEGVS